MAGLSLVELLIAMVLGLLLAVGVMQIHVGSVTAERDRDARLRMQENARFALNFLTSEIRMAGYLGCTGSLDGLAANDTLRHRAGSAMQPGYGIQGWEAADTAPGAIANSTLNVPTLASTDSEWTGSQFPGFAIPSVQAVPNSDILRVWGGVGNASPVDSITPGATPQFTTTSNAGIEDDDFLIISDCEQADIVQACDASTAGLVTTVQLGTACPMGNVTNPVLRSAAPAEVMRLQASLFYVGKRGDAATNSPALFRATLDADGTIAAPSELVEGVESMQLLYGVNTDRDTRASIDAWLTADQVPDWQAVIAVRISLLMVSTADGIVPEPMAYDFNGVTYNGLGTGGALPRDRRIRRTLQTTASLRNRALGG